MGPRCRRRQPNLGSSRVSHACVMVIWPNKSLASEHLPQSALTILQSNTTSCSIRGYTTLMKIRMFALTSCMVRVPSRMVRMTFSMHRTCFGCWLALDKVRGHLRAKFKIPYQCVHLVSTSGQCDAVKNSPRCKNFEVQQNDETLSNVPTSAITTTTAYLTQ